MGVIKGDTRSLDSSIYGGFPKLGVLFGGPYNKDYNILGSPNFGKLPYGASGVRVLAFRDLGI